MWVQDLDFAGEGEITCTTLGDNVEARKLEHQCRVCPKSELI